MSVELSDKLGKDIDGFVETTDSRGQKSTVGVIKGSAVYEIRVGGPPHVIGHIKDGVAYDLTVGGKPGILGAVIYTGKRIKQNKFPR